MEKTLKSPLDCNEIKPVNSKGNQPWILTGRSGAETETPILWPPDGKVRLTKKDPDAGEDWGQAEKGVAEDEMVGWYHRLNGHEFEQSPEDGEGQGSQVCCSRGVHKETQLSDWTTNTLATLAPFQIPGPDKLLSLSRAFFC